MTLSLKIYEKRPAKPPSTSTRKCSQASVFNLEPTGGGVCSCVSPTRWHTRIVRTHPTRHSLRSFRVGLLKYRVFDTRRGVGQYMSMDIIQGDGWP